MAQACDLAPSQRQYLNIAPESVSGSLDGSRKTYPKGNSNTQPATARVVHQRCEEEVSP